MPTTFFRSLTVAAVLLLTAMKPVAADPQAGIPAKLDQALEFLLSFNQNKEATDLDQQLVEQMLTFVLDSPKQLGDHFSLGARNGMTSDYFEFNLDLSLKSLLDYVYNPDIPSHLLLPSSVRRSHWIETEGRPEPPPKLSALIAAEDGVRIIRGIEFIENTPDETSGAYYAYELERTLILLHHQGQPVLISLSHQPHKSQVGKKGIVLGSDEQWDYIYTGEKGCTLAGLGWADSYMYDSASIMVYCQVAQPSVHVKCGVFKWLKAGWGGINLVKPHHIRKGVERFARSFKTVLESPRLPAVSELARGFEQISTLSTKTLQSHNRAYFEALQNRRHQETKGARKDLLNRFFSDESYLHEMKRQELVTVVQLEYLKYLLGKEHYLDVHALALWTNNRQSSHQ